MNYARPDARLVSYPRSGRSWLVFMLNDVHRRLKLPGREMLMAKHDAAMVHRPDRLREYTASKRRLYGGRDVILLVRDPRDVVVSLYYMLTVRHARRPEGRRFARHSLSEFLRSEHGLSFVVRFLNDWAAQRHVPRSFLEVRYEALCAHPLLELRRVMPFLGVDASDRALGQAIKRYSFKSMQWYDRMRLLPEFGLPRREARRPEALSVRRGEPGAWREELSEADARWAADYLKARLDNHFSHFNAEP